jgi:SAM-dependent methyltransferase
MAGSFVVVYSLSLIHVSLSQVEVNHDQFSFLKDFMAGSSVIAANGSSFHEHIRYFYDNNNFLIDSGDPARGISSSNKGLGYWINGSSAPYIEEFAEKILLEASAGHTSIRVLNLGVGGATLAGQVLCKDNSHAISEIINVDIDPLVIEMAKKFAVPRMLQGRCANAAPRCKFLRADAFHVDKVISGSFSVIVADFFYEHYFGTIVWWKMLARLSTPRTVLLVNARYGTYVEYVRFFRDLDAAGWTPFIDRTHCNIEDALDRGGCTHTVRALLTTSLASKV